MYKLVIKSGLIFDNVNGIATISGSGSTWDYYQDGTAVPDYKF